MKEGRGSTKNTARSIASSGETQRFRTEGAETELNEQMTFGLAPGDGKKKKMGGGGFSGRR